MGDDEVFYSPLKSLATQYGSLEFFRFIFKDHTEFEMKDREIKQELQQIAYDEGKMVCVNKL